MEPVTHFLTGACIGRAGFNRRTAYATLAATLAAEAPDIDVLWGLGGPIVSFQHHRGITHTFIAAPFVALATTCLIWLLDRFFSRWLVSRKVAEPQPIRWLWLWFTALIATLSHLLLDWTNNYGLRPFFPFNARWYSADLVFIAEPIMWLLLVLALLLPAIFGLADREIGARSTRFRGRGWAIFALSGIVLLWCVRWAMQAEARNLVSAPEVTDVPVTRIALEPYPVNPFRWHAILETETSWQIAEVDTHTGAVQTDSHTDSLLKPAYTPAVATARQTRLGQVYLDWAQWPVVRDLGPRTIPATTAPSLGPGRQWSAVQFADLRFAYNFLDTLTINGSSQPLDPLLLKSPIAGWVYIIDGHEDGGQFMNGHEQK